MAQEYTVLEFEGGDFKDDYGNTWGTAVFEGVGEPIKWVVKDPTRVEIGKAYYGRLEEKTSKAGKPYTRFYAEKKEDGSYSMDKKNPAVEENIAKAVALKAAVEFCSGDVTPEYVLEVADIFLPWLQGEQVKDSKGEKDEKSGYEQAKEARDKIKEKETEKEVEDLMNSGEKVNLDEIPF